MKKLCLYLVLANVLVHPTDILASDHAELDAFCQKLEKIELEGIKTELAEGHLSKKEADNETSLILTTEQCVCYFQNMNDRAGTDYTTRLQKYLLASVPLSEAVEPGEPKLPDDLNEVELLNGIATACGIED